MAKKTAKMLVVQSAVRDAVKGQKFNMAGDFATALSEKVMADVKQACGRCKANGRKTVRAADL